MAHKNYRKETNCLNCGAVVEKQFCPECGQENLDLHENFFHLAGHFISDYFHFDSKFFRSLVPLFFKPGFLTKEYLEGRRVKYIHPLRLFFFVTIVSVIITDQYYRRFETEIKADSIKATTTTVEDGKEVQKSIPLENVTGEEKVKVEQMSEGLYEFFHHLKYISFFLLPIYALFFKMLYYRKRLFYVDHLIYTLHLQSFIFSLSAILLLFPLLIYPPAHKFINMIISFPLVIYIVISLRYLYQQSWAKTIVKSLLATLFAGLATSLVMIYYLWF